MWAKIVALRKESVDRNFCVVCVIVDNNVALRKESVDRNIYTSDCAAQRAVALRKESVDRNVNADRQQSNALKSLSARRAWIEMSRRL